jgi:uncharacterized membrane protein YeiH
MTDQQTRGFGAIIWAADLAATFALALQASLVALAAGLDPVGVAVIAFVGAMGGGIIRDLLLGAHPIAAMSRMSFSVAVLIAGAMTWTLFSLVSQIPEIALVLVDAVGLALAAIAGTEKALAFKVNPLVATFVGTVGSVGGGILRDIILNIVPHVLRTDFYATAAFAGAVIIVVGNRFGLPPRWIAVTAGLVVFALRVAGVLLHWELPHLSGAIPAR